MVVASAETNSNLKIIFICSSRENDLVKCHYQLMTAGWSEMEHVVMVMVLPLAAIW